jgi:hypothetical protein
VATCGQICVGTKINLRSQENILEGTKTIFACELTNLRRNEKNLRSYEHICVVTKQICVGTNNLFECAKLETQ